MAIRNNRNLRNKHKEQIIKCRNRKIKRLENRSCPGNINFDECCTKEPPGKLQTSETE